MMSILDTNSLLNYCLTHNKSLTPTRALIIKTLSKHEKPKSAYDLRNEINKKKDNKINISTVYRVLDFWIKLGLVHKITSINKYFLCVEPKNKHTHMLNYCTKCEKVFETCNKSMELDLKKGTSKLNLRLDNNHTTVEIPVVCASCS